MRHKCHCPKLANGAVTRAGFVPSLDQGVPVVGVPSFDFSLPTENRFVTIQGFTVVDTKVCSVAADLHSEMRRWMFIGEDFDLHSPLDCDEKLDEMSVAASSTFPIISVLAGVTKCLHARMIEWNDILRHASISS